jgi:hypothetical protein
VESGVYFGKPHSEIKDGFSEERRRQLQNLSLTGVMHSAGLPRPCVMKFPSLEMPASLCNTQLIVTP